MPVPFDPPFVPLLPGRDPFPGVLFDHAVFVPLVGIPAVFVPIGHHLFVAIPISVGQRSY
jgi:hypothetical protein